MMLRHLLQRLRRVASRDARTPADAETYFARGNSLIAQGRADEAIACYRSALSLQPEFPEVLSNLGNVLKDQGRLEEAVESYGKAVQLCPEFAEAQFNLGLACQELGQNSRAIACFEAAVALRPDFADAQYSLGYLYANEDRRTEALACFRSALSRNPDFAEARWSEAMAQLLAVCGPADDAARGRAAFAAKLQELERWFDGPRAAVGARAVGSLQPFRVAYHEENNRDLLERYGTLCARLMQHWSQRESIHPIARRRGQRINRVAVVSGHLRNHSVWHAIVKGWFRNIDRRRFELSAFCIAAEEDEQTRLAKGFADHFVQGRRTLRQWVDGILAQRPDCILYPEIGMDAMTLRLASLRLAPLQVAAWGHPETSGLPTIDYYLSSEDFEPAGAQAHYTERLVPLPHLGCYVEPSNAPAIEPDLPAWGLDDNVPLILCPGTPFKYAPAHDAVFAQIASRLRQCQFVFFTHSVPGLSERLRQRLAVTFRSNGLDPEAHLRFIPWLNQPAFHGLMQRADLCLDSIGFSGFNTALQAVECALPIVTREGRFMRGRFASGILKRLGLPELVAATDEEYVALAVRLVEDAPFRKDASERLVARRAALFRDEAPIRALEELLLKVISTAAP